MRYFFEAGAFADLSYAELSSVLEAYNISKDSLKRYSDKIFVLESKDADPDTLDRIFNRLGGYIRYGELIEDLDTFLSSFKTDSKITFGVSVIGESDITPKNLQKLNNDIKRSFKEQGISSRFLIPKKLELNAAQIINNDILNKGFELCILNLDKEQLYGKTISIQNLESFVHRDVNKPGMDYSMGMLPHKLARMMCNLTRLRDGILWDPFCGSGTVLMEALTLGFDVIGTDIDSKAIENSQRNIHWLSQEGLIGAVRYNTQQMDIHNIERRALKDLKRTGIKAVVCEPFMGPPQRKVISQHKAQKLLDDVKSLYRSLFTALDTVASKGFRVVLVLPSYKTDKGWATFNISELIGKKWDVDNKKYSKGDLKWKRNNSIITRDIFVLTKR